MRSGESNNSGHHSPWKDLPLPRLTTVRAWLGQRGGDVLSVYNNLIAGQLSVSSSEASPRLCDACRMCGASKVHRTELWSRRGVCIVENPFSPPRPISSSITLVLAWPRRRPPLGPGYSSSISICLSTLFSFILSLTQSHTHTQ